MLRWESSKDLELDGKERLARRKRRGDTGRQRRRARESWNGDVGGGVERVEGDAGKPEDIPEEETQLERASRKLMWKRRGRRGEERGGCVLL